jgi:hypothetical protein
LTGGLRNPDARKNQGRYVGQEVCFGACESKSRRVDLPRCYLLPARVNAGFEPPADLVEHAHDRHGGVIPIGGGLVLGSECVARTGLEPGGVLGPGGVVLIAELFLE